MPVITATQVLERPVDEVFTTVADAANFHRWNPTITTARQLSDGRAGPRIAIRVDTAKIRNGRSGIRRAYVLGDRL
jgi:hypothetical protein